MKVKTSELTGAALDWVVAKCENINIHLDVSIPSDPLLVLPGEEDKVDDFYLGYTPSTDWERGGPIIERERINIVRKRHGGQEHTHYWEASIGYENEPSHRVVYGLTPLIAAMRCFVASKLGDGTDVPEVLV